VQLCFAVQYLHPYQRKLQTIIVTVHKLLSKIGEGCAPLWGIYSWQAMAAHGDPPRSEFRFWMF
jgi:hypothetical protein